MSSSLQPHELQHARLPCPSLCPRVCSDLCPLSQWCYLTITFCAALSPFAFDFSQHQCLFQWVGSLHQISKELELHRQSFQNIYSRLISFRIDWFELLAVQGTLKSLLQHHNLKASIPWHSDFFMVWLSNLYVQFSSVTQSCPTLCDPMNHSTPGLPVNHHLRSSLRLMPIESVMPSSHLILCHPLLLLPPIPPSIRVFSNESTLRMR